MNCFRIGQIIIKLAEQPATRRVVAQIAQEAIAQVKKTSATQTTSRRASQTKRAPRKSAKLAEYVIEIDQLPVIEKKQPAASMTEFWKSCKRTLLKEEKKRRTK